MSNTDLRNNALVWFRHDLRLEDNQALVAACEYAETHQSDVRAIFFVTPKQWASHDVAPKLFCYFSIDTACADWFSRRGKRGATP